MNSLIPRFYDVNSVKISIDGIDIRDNKIKSSWDSIGIVQQDVYLLSGTIAENISYGKLNATKYEIP